MSRIAKKFSLLKRQSRKGLIPYLTGGDPNPELTVPIAHALVHAGADIIEIGVPFSDPMADGPVNQRASDRALKHNVSLTDVLAMVREFRETDNDTPVVLMGYMNPIEVMGPAKFSQAAAEAGVDGVITVDLPPEEATSLLVEFKRYEIDPIFLIAPTTDNARIELIDQNASGFLYYVSLKGVTGAASLDSQAVAKRLNDIRSVSDLPVSVGFGIKDAESAAAISKIADAVVVGSALIQKIEASISQPDKIIAEASGFIAELRKAIDSTGPIDGR